MRAVVVIASLAGIGLMLCGCSSTKSSLLVNGGMDGETCLVTAADSIRLFETTTVENPTPSDIEITGIELNDSKNLRLKSFEVVLLNADSTGSGFSPDDRPELSSDTATLAPEQFATIVAQVEVVNPEKEGASSGLSITHRSLTDSDSHVMDAPVSLKMVPYGTTCN